MAGPSATDKPGPETPGADTEQLAEQIAQLQADIKAIAATLQKLAGERLSEAQKSADERYEEAIRQGREMLDDVSDQASEIERSLKHRIRDRPLTAVASAVGIGYLLALLTRR